MSGCACKITFDKSYSLQDKIDYLERHMVSFKHSAEKEEIKGDLIERDAYIKHHARYSKKHKELVKLKST
jgi:hypothetical protein